MAIKAGPLVMLTGAGFTHNFGAPLGEGMWAHIYNRPEVQASSTLRDIMLKDFDYESVYYTVLEGDYDLREKQALAQAVRDAYQNVDDTIASYRYSADSPFPVNIYKVQALIRQFGLQDEMGFLFSLNQDLFIERFYRNGPLAMIPGIPGAGSWFQSDRARVPFTESPCTTLRGEQDVISAKDHLASRPKLVYVKLHGSQNWRHSSAPEAMKDVMVIGMAKEKQIQAEPLLSFYFDLFRDVLSQPDCRLLTIGYGFRDRHLNNIIVEAVKHEHGLKVYVVSPSRIEDFQKKMFDSDSRPGARDIYLRGLAGYFPYAFPYIFTKDSDASVPEREICRCFFGSTGWRPD